MIHIVTGSSSGIGREVTKDLLARGHTVVGIARDHAKFTPEGDYHAMSIDLANVTRADMAFKQLLKDFKIIDTIICAAGYGAFKTVEQFSLNQMQNIMNVNFLSQVNLVRHCLPRMKQRNAGKIIMLGSEAALQGQKFGSLYCASKFALRGFCQSLRSECVANEIAVTLINPGLVNTAFFDNLSFAPGNEATNVILPQQISQLIMHVIDMNANCVVEEINCQPMKKVIAKG